MNENQADLAARAALTTLRRLGYVWRGGDEWQLKQFDFAPGRQIYMANSDEMTLGEAVDIFGVKYPANAKVYIDYNNLSIGKFSPHASRWNYNHLAFEPSQEYGDAYSVFCVFKSCVGKYYEGYRGGTYRMDRDTPIYIANYSQIGRKIIGFSFDEKNNTVVILTDKLN